MSRNVYRISDMNEAQASIDKCDGATAYPEAYTGDVVWMSAHRTACRTRPGFGGIEKLRQGDRLQWQVGGVTKTYEVIGGIISTLDTADSALRNRPEGTALMLQTSKSTNVKVKPYEIYIKYARLVNTDPPPVAAIDVAGVDASGNWAIASSDRSRLRAPSSQALTRWSGPGFANLAGDVNGDGLDDLIAKDTNGTWYVALNNGGRFTPCGYVWLTQWAAGADDIVDVGDFNGDGRDDIVAKDRNGTWYTALSNGSYFIPSGNLWLTQWAAGNTFKIDVGDFNGDGRDDVVAKDTNGTWYVAQSYGSGFTPAGYVWMSQWAAGDGHALGVGDFNGDHRDDVAAKDANGTWYVALSNGSQFVPSGNLWMTGWAAGTGFGLDSGDFNGDGRDDLIANDGAGGWFVALSNGNSFTPSGYQWLSGPRFADFVVGEFVTGP